MNRFSSTLFALSSVFATGLLLWSAGIVFAFRDQLAVTIRFTTGITPTLFARRHNNTIHRSGGRAALKVPSSITAAR